MKIVQSMIFDQFWLKFHFDDSNEFFNEILWNPMPIILIKSRNSHEMMN